MPRKPFSSSYKSRQSLWGTVSSSKKRVCTGSDASFPSLLPISPAGSVLSVRAERGKTLQLHAADPEMQAKAAAKAKPKKPAAGTETTTSAGAATTGKTGSETTARAGTEGRPAGDTGSLQSAHASTGPDAAPRVSTGESTGQTSATRPDDVSTSRPGSSPASAATSKSGTDTRSRGALHDAFRQALSRVVPGRNDRDH